MDEILDIDPVLIGRFVEEGRVAGVRTLPLAAMPLAPYRHSIEDWLEGVGADAVLIRPDRHIFGTGDPERLLAAWRAATEVPVGFKRSVAVAARLGAEIPYNTGPRRARAGVKRSLDMGCIINSGSRYRMPVMFGPAPGPRQHPEGRMWTPEEGGRMNSDWLKIAYRTDPENLERLLPPGFSLRGDPIVSVSCAWFRNLYWLAGRGYGILSVDFPVSYQGRDEQLDGALCPVIWEGSPDAIMTGREELGFPKMFANFTDISFDEAAGTARCAVSWLDYTFFEIELSDLVEDSNPEKKLPGSGGGAQMYYKYMPRTSPGGRDGADNAYVTTSAAPAGTGGLAVNINFDDFDFRRWTGAGEINWNRATFEQLPLQHHIVNGMANLPIVEVVDAELVRFSGPGIGIAMNSHRAVEPAVA